LYIRRHGSKENANMSDSALRVKEFAIE
jgi:hypothetical protein